MNINKEYHQSESALEQERIQINAAKKDPRAFSVLYDKYYIQIFRYIFKRTGDENLTADLTSQVFMKALQSLRKYEFRGVPIVAWFYQIARNELNLSFRANKNDRVVDVKTEQLGDIIDEFEEEKNEEKMQLLLEALPQLTSEELELLEMRYFEKRPFMEVALILEISENNAKVKMHRIIKKLKNIILSDEQVI